MSSSESSVERIEKDINTDEVSVDQLKAQSRMLTPILGKKVPPIPSEEERTVYPLHHTSLINKIFFWWLIPVMKVGYKRTLQAQDLWYLDDKLKIETYYAAFEGHLANQIAQSKAEHAKIIEAKKLEGTYNSEEDDEFAYPKYALVWALFHTFKWEYIASIGFIVAANICFTLNPLLTRALINFVQRRALGVESKVNNGIGYAIGVSALLLFAGLLINHFLHLSMMVGAKVKAILTKAMLEKSLRLNAKGKQKFPAGKITSIMGTDLARIDLAIGIQPFGIAFPVPVAIAIALLIVNIGVSALVGIGIFIITVGIIGFSTKKLFKYRKSVIKFTDMRVGLMKELLNNLKIIKFYSWENSYGKTISDVRTREMNTIFKMQVLRSIITSFAISLPQLSSMASFLVLHAISNRNAAQIFSSLTLFNTLAQQIMMVPMALATSSDALIGVMRVTEILQCGEINQEEQDAYRSNIESLVERNVALAVTNASFEWRTFELEQEELDQLKQEKFEKEDVQETIADSISGTSDTEKKAEDQVVFTGLHDIDLEIKKGEFVVITGVIGSGKSSLLNALTGFMHKSKGDVKVNGSMLLCGQPWVQNTTVKKNILFGEEFDHQKYKDVIFACSLDADLDILPAGDRTEIGERGITLSGGQKARINLARAVYADKDIILLDDVLSAVDARVGKHIMDECVMGLLAQKTRILATHQLSLIGTADRIIFLNGDGSIDVGTLEELNSRNAGFAALMSYNAESKSEDGEGEDEASVLDSVQEEEEKELIRKQTLQDEEGRKNFEARNGNGVLMSKEDRAVNQISYLVYKRYIMLGSGIFKQGIIPLFLMVVILTTFCQLFTNTWLSFWTDNRFSQYGDGFHIGIYVMFTMLTIVFATIEFTLIVYISNRAAKQLNIKSVQRLLKAPMAFMDTTPMGRILNRFTKDTESLDNEISEQIRLFIYPFANICGVIILCIIYLPWFAIAVPFLIFFFMSIASFYQASGREVKRVEAIQRSYVYNNFNETLNGVLTIKAYGAEGRFMQKNNYLINKMNEAYYITIANQRWLAIHLDMVGCVLCLVVSLLCVTRQFHIAAASVGLLLSYILQIVGQLSLLIRAMTQVENEMNSVERLCHYAFELDQERPFEISETKPAPEWPQDGTIEFKNVCLSYRPGLPLVLKNVSFPVGAGQKIGICGRTGAGKSSIMTALFRISEMSSGSIHIDGVDISKLGLRDLRSKLSIIPQDPVLLRGSIRKNLDPFNEHSDDWLWSSLHKSGLIDDLASAKLQTTELHKFHLDQMVEDDGANFSLGERQLIALARAVVRDSKILILDEATSSVDYETDAKIQSTIAREFGHCTILCIAHRLKTIIDYDKILVLDKGEVKEFDTPWNLFLTDGGIFQSMCEKSNIVEEDFKIKN